MKKIIYLLVFMFSVSLSANEIKEIEKKKGAELQIVKIEKVKDVLKNGKVFFTRYRGKCLDGHTFYFTAYTREVAQEVVNTYCAFRRSIGGEGGDNVNEN
ncbi:MAG: hypothetical protein GKR88_11420 [Flavobacteriaceae bacterium]|nr:MAG: hypothetical protein GKR88_11420 [Flavobacteriaceae bacterium]